MTGEFNHRLHGFKNQVLSVSSAVNGPPMITRWHRIRHPIPKAIVILKQRSSMRPATKVCLVLPSIE